MNNIKFNQTGGFPLSTNIADAMQIAYSVFNFLGNLAGNFGIISGCDVVGGNVSDGAVFINGELLSFKGAALGTNVIIRSDFEKEIFEDGVSKDVVENRYATFGTAVENYPWSNFVKVNNLQILASKFTGLQTEIDQVQYFFDVLLASFNSHAQNKNNPHQVTAKQVGILKSGNIFIGDVQGKNVGWIYNGADYKVELLQKSANSPTQGGDDLYRVTLNSILPTSNYTIVGSLIFLSNWNNDNDIIVSFGNKTAAYFDIALREIASQIQNVSIDYLIIQN